MSILYDNRIDDYQSEEIKEDDSGESLSSSHQNIK